jgi:hypothetical protein
VRKFELNFRPPEEFFFNFEIQSTQEILQIASTKNVPTESSSSTLRAGKDVMSGAAGCDSQSNSLTRTVVPDISKSSLKRKDSKKMKNKTKDSPITPKSGMLSCFGLKSLKKKKDKSKR